MSEDRNHGEQKEERGHGKEDHGEAASKGGGARKLLIGAAAAASAALVLGAGYFAWKSFSPSHEHAQTASNETYDSEPLPAGQRDTRAATSESAATDVAAPASESASPATERAASPAARRAARARAVPEETIVATPASATATNSDELVVTGRRRVWTRMPSARRLATYYPERLLERGREGEARLHCTVLAGGALDCARVDETPGFGDAALRVARSLRHAPQLADGSDATGAAVNLRVIFRLSEEDRRRGRA